MTQIKQILAVAFLLFSFHLTAYSSSGIGYEVSYKQVDSLKYDVDFIVYRYCGGLKLNTNFTTPYVVCQTSGYKKSLTWKIASIQEIKTQCDSIGGRCNPSNTSFTGNGYERIVLRSTVDFKLSAYDSFYKAGCKSVRFEFDDCCRNSKITTGLANDRMYTYAELNLAIDDGNTSPSFTSPPLIKACCNQPVYYNIGAVDNTDYDSLSYAFAEPLESFGSASSYAGNYKYDNPIDCYFPGSLKHPYKNPNAQPPIGMSLDPEYGDLIFTPVKCNEHTVIVIEVTEWRKDKTSGKMVSVGVTRRDIELLQELCPTNNAPIITSESFSYRACEGEQLCFSIFSEDNVKVPPPPMPKPKGDSTFLTWNNGIPQGKFVVTEDTFETARFCWTPDSGSARAQPYTFIVYADDDKCGGVLKTQRTFKISVNPKAPSFTLSYDSLGCGLYKIDNSMSPAELNRYKFELKIKAITGKGLKAQLLSTQRDSSNNPEDVLKFNRNGIYELLYTTECGKTIFDTMHITDFPDVPLFNDLEVCNDHGSIDLKQLDTINKGGTWSCRVEPRLVNSNNEFLTDSIANKNTTQRRMVYYSVKGGSGNCALVDSFEIMVNPLPRVELRDGIFCQNLDTINLKRDKIIMLPGGAGLSLGRQKWSCVDCGSYNPAKIIEDIGSGLPGAPQDFILHIDTSVIKLKSKTADTLYLELDFRNPFACHNRDTAKIIINRTPTLTSNSSSDICWNAGVVNLSELANVSLRGGTWSAIDRTGYANDSLFNLHVSDSFFNTLTLGNGITNSDSSYMLNYSFIKDFCTVQAEHPLVIRQVDFPTINTSVFAAVHSSTSPFAFCTLDLPVTMTASNSGIWSCSDSGAVTNNVFDPRKVTKVNEVITIWNKRIGGNCSATDSVLVKVNSLATLTLSNDTAITWYASTMSKRVKAQFEYTTGIDWLPLTGGSVSNISTQEVDWSFSSNKDSITRKLLYAKTKVTRDNVCPFAEKTMLVEVYPTPCMDVWMKFDNTQKTLTLSPSNTTLPYYFWKVDGQTSTRLNPIFNLTNAKDSVVLVTLKVTNQLGDTCLSYNKINVNNGSVKDLGQTISLYPNPVKQGFSIETSADITKAKVRIYDGNGKMVQTLILDKNYIDCSKLAAGMYTVRIETVAKQYLGRFVKE